jgi:hypothetical protein
VGCHSYKGFSWKKWNQINIKEKLKYHRF